jgi:hypothetical protein
MPTASHSPIEASAERTRGVAELIVAAQLSPAPVADRQSVEVTLVSEVGRPATSVRGRVTVTAAAASATLSNEDACGSDGVVNSVGTGSEPKTPPWLLPVKQPPCRYQHQGTPQ